MPNIKTPIRRVITGVKNDRSFFAAVENIEPLMAMTGHGFSPIFGADTNTIPTTGSLDYRSTIFPPAGGYRVHVIEFPAKNATYEGPLGVWPEHGLTKDESRGDGTGMHQSDSIDFAIVLDGEIGLESEDGTEVLLHPGDVVVQNGAMHAWHNKDVACRVCFVILGAVRESVR
jgi:hypothetical protein